MKKIQKLLLMGAALFAAFGFVGCQEDEFTPGVKDSGAQVYFPTTFATEQLVGDDVTSLTIPVKRIDTTDALTVYIASEYDTSMFTVPETVSFAAGEDTANLVIAFKATLVSGKEYPINLLVNDPANITQYGYSQLSLTVMVWPWEYLGVGQFRDDYLGCMFNGVNFCNIAVEIYAHKVQEGVYMIEDMYGWPYLTEAFGGTQEAIEAQLVTYEPTNITIDCSDPNQVFIPQQNTGIVDIDSSYGMYQIATIAYGSLVDGVITFPVEGLGLICEMGSMAVNKSGMFRLVLPGVELTDYSLAATYGGMRVEADNETAKAVVDFTYGADVAAIRYVVAEGNLSDDPSALYDAIVAGGDNVYEVVTNGTGEVSVEAMLDAMTFYTFAAMPVNAAGELVEKNAVATSFFFAGVGSTVPDVDVAVEMMRISDFNPEMSAEYPDYANMLIKVSGTELSKIKIFINQPAIFADPTLAGYESIEDIIYEFGQDITEQSLPYIEADGFDILLISVDPDTEYQAGVYAENDYGKRAYVISEPLKSASLPAYEGSLQIGDYYMSYQADEESFFENVFTVKHTAVENQFLVANFGVNGAPTDFYAVYDEAAGTFTLDGTMAGREDDGPLFGYMTYYFDEAGTQVMGWLSYATEDSETGADPCVFKVVDNKIAELTTTLAVAVADAASMQLLGYIGYYGPGAQVVPYVAEPAPASVMSVMPAAESQSMKAVRVQKPFATNATFTHFEGSQPASMLMSVKTGVCEPLAKDYSRVALVNANVPVLK